MKQNILIIIGVLGILGFGVISLQLGLGWEDHLGLADHILQFFHSLLGIGLGFKTNGRPGEVFVFAVADGNAKLAVLPFLDLDDSGALLGG